MQRGTDASAHVREESAFINDQNRHVFSAFPSVRPGAKHQSAILQFSWPKQPSCSGTTQCASEPRQPRLHLPPPLFPQGTPPHTPALPCRLLATCESSGCAPGGAGNRQPLARIHLTDTRQIVDWGALAGWRGPGSRGGEGKDPESGWQQRPASSKRPLVLSPRLTHRAEVRQSTEVQWRTSHHAAVLYSSGER